MLPVRVGHVWVKNWVWGFGEQAFKGHCAWLWCGEEEEKGGGGRQGPAAARGAERREEAAAAAARTAALGAAR